MRGVAALLLPVALFCAQAPSDFRGWFDRGVAQFRSNEFRQAAESMEKAVALDPSHAGAQLYLGISYLRQGAYAQAEKHLRRAVELDGKNAVPMGFLGELKLAERKLDEAQGWYERLAGLEPTNAEAHYNLGRIAWYRLEAAQSAARNSSGMKPGDPGPIRAAAIRQKFQKEYGGILDAGIQSFGRVLAIQPENEEAMKSLGALMRVRADFRDYQPEYAQDIAAADQWVQKAEETQRRKSERTAGLNSRAAAMPSGGVPRRIRITGDVMEGKLIHRVKPAKGTQSGDVVLEIVIDAEGRVSEVKAVSGSAELVPLARDAVKQWVYRPTAAQGMPVEVTTQVTVRF
jgi:TonB family protein